MQVRSCSTLTITHQLFIYCCGMVTLNILNSPILTICFCFHESEYVHICIPFDMYYNLNSDVRRRLSVTFDVPFVTLLNIFRSIISPYWMLYNICHCSLFLQSCCQNIFKYYHYFLVYCVGFSFLSPQWLWSYTPETLPWHGCLITESWKL